MVICPDCGKDVKDAKFCSNCGARLPDAVPVEEVVPEVEEPVVEASEESVVEESPAEEVVPEVVEEPVVEEAPVEEVVEETVVEEITPEESEETIEANIVKKSKFCTNCGCEVDFETAFCPKCGFSFMNAEKPATKFCQNCGKKIDINAEICPHCGVRVAGVSVSGEKNVLLSAILSFLFPGLGHLYLGLNKKGISFIIAYIISAILIMLFVGIILVLIVWLWALIDSIKSTEALNKGEHVEDKLF